MVVVNTKYHEKVQCYVINERAAGNWQLQSITTALMKNLDKIDRDFKQMFTSGDAAAKKHKHFVGMYKKRNTAFWKAYKFFPGKSWRKIAIVK